MSTSSLEQSWSGVDVGEEGAVGLCVDGIQERKELTTEPAEATTATVMEGKSDGLYNMEYG